MADKKEFAIGVQVKFREPEQVIFLFFTSRNVDNLDTFVITDIDNKYVYLRNKNGDIVWTIPQELKIYRPIPTSIEE